MIEVLKQALDALEKVKRRAVVMGSTGAYREGQLDALKAVSEDVKPAITSLQQAIKELEKQEPVATVTSETGADITMSWWHEPALPVGTKLFTHPPQRTEKEPVAWKHDCVALLQNNIELWVDGCPHCGKPRTVHSPQRKPLTDEIVGLLKEARKIIRASSSRNLVKDWDERTTKAIAAHGIKE